MIGCSTWPGEPLRSKRVTIRVNSYRIAWLSGLGILPGRAIHKEAIMDKWYWADEVIEELEDQRKRERDERRSQEEDVE